MSARCAEVDARISADTCVEGKYIAAATAKESIIAHSTVEDIIAFLCINQIIRRFELRFNLIAAIVNLELARSA
ncbi:MAG: hypothetical protein ABI417_01710 [Coleofasciculaceae cyanobacterium]